MESVKSAEPMEPMEPVEPPANAPDADAAIGAPTGERQEHQPPPGATTGHGREGPGHR